MALMQWHEILGILGAVYVGMLVILTAVVHLEQWLAAGLEPPGLIAVPPVLDLDELELDELELDELELDELELDDQGAA